MTTFEPYQLVGCSDEDTIENRRNRWITHENGFTYDPATSSRQWVEEREGRHSYWGVALYINVYGKYFVHHYGQWHRLCYVEPGVEAAVKATAKYAPDLMHQIFGKLHEEGQGAAFTPVTPP